jgi:hypothetical protein
MQSDKVYVRLLIFTRLVNLIQTQYEISELILRGLTCLIKWVGLKLTYIVLYSYLKTVQIQYTTVRVNNFDTICKPYTKLVR